MGFSIFEDTLFFPEPRIYKEIVTLDELGNPYRMKWTRDAWKGYYRALRMWGKSQERYFDAIGGLLTA